MSVSHITIDPANPTPPFATDAVFVAKGLASLPEGSADRRRLIVCLVGAAEVTVRTEVVEVFPLTTATTGLLVEAGVDILSVGGPDNVATIIFSGARQP
jgi:hypothetical protein